MAVFISKDDALCCDVQYMEIYIPLYYFDETRKFAIDKSDVVTTLGIFNVGIFSDGKLKSLETAGIGTFIDIYVHDTEIRDVTLKNNKVEKCKVFKYIKGAKVINPHVIQDDENAKKFLNILLSGHLPDIVPYSKALDIWKSNQKINGVNFGLPSLYLELVLSVLFRNPNDLSQKFSSIAGKEGVGDYDYATASIRQICQFNSTFTALTFEDFDSMVTSSINKTHDNAKEKYSPVEQVIKY